jgi:hypothetical protein
MMPASRWCGVREAVTDPTDHAVEPPKNEFFSRSTVRLPAAAASIAAASPDPPPPTTKTSQRSTALWDTVTVVQSGH